MTDFNIDINCDLGEGAADDSSILPLISSCNIATGGHAGDEESVKKTATLAFKNKVTIGAHPSYPDKNNFGRFSMDLPKDELINAIRNQLNFFDSTLTTLNVTWNHIKPHGALYNDIAINSNLARIFIDALQPYKNKVLVVPPNSEIAQIAKECNFRIRFEAFADRNYTHNLKLVPRKKENALIEDPVAVLNHIKNMVNGVLFDVFGEKQAIKADTYCIHGDTPNALKILQYLTTELPNHNIHIKK